MPDTTVNRFQKPRNTQVEEFVAIAQTYPPGGPDVRILTLLQDPAMSRSRIAQTLGCCDTSVGKAKQRLRTFAQTGTVVPCCPSPNREKEAAEFAQIAETYPADGLDIKVLMWLKNPEASMPFIAQILGRDDRSIRYAKKRLRAFAQTGTVRPDRKREALPADPTAVESWLEAPLPVSRAGRKRWKRVAGGEASRAA